MQTSFEILEAEKKGLPSFATGCHERQDTIQDVEDYLRLAKQLGAPMPHYWRVEQKAKTRLLVAKRKTGDWYTLDLRPAEVITPPGWTWSYKGELIETLGLLGTR